MQDFVNLIKFYSQDEYAFLFVELVFISLFLYATCKDWWGRRKETGYTMKVRRGNAGQKKLGSLLTILFTVIIFEFSLTVSIDGYKTLFTILNMYLAYRLCFSSWFRNKLIGFIIRYEKFVEKH